MQNRERDMRERNAADPQATAGKLLKRSGEGILFNDQRVRQGSHQGRAMVTRDQKIILGEMRQMGVRGLLVFCSDYRCAHLAKISGDRWPDHGPLVRS
jgi:hypothetical protein